jgi:hypothetical protein
MGKCKSPPSSETAGNLRYEQYHLMCAALLCSTASVCSFWGAEKLVFQYTRQAEKSEVRET